MNTMPISAFYRAIRNSDNESQYTSSTVSESDSLSSLGPVDVNSVAANSSTTSVINNSQRPLLAVASSSYLRAAISEQSDEWLDRVNEVRIQAEDTISNECPREGRLATLFKMAFNKRLPEHARRLATEAILDLNKLEFGGARATIPMIPHNLYHLQKICKSDPVLESFARRIDRAVDRVHQQIRVELSRMEWAYNHQEEAGYQVRYVPPQGGAITTEYHHYHSDLPRTRMATFRADPLYLMALIGGKLSRQTSDTLTVNHIQNLIRCAVSNSNVTEDECIAILADESHLQGFRRAAERRLFEILGQVKPIFIEEFMQALSELAFLPFSKKGMMDYLKLVHKQPPSFDKVMLYETLLGTVSFMREPKVRQELLLQIRCYPEGNDRTDLLELALEDPTHCISVAELFTLQRCLPPFV